jgi:hypothetical protein
VIHAVKRRPTVVGAALAVLFATAALLASCAPSRLVSQQANPDYVGKSFKTVMVVAVTGDEVLRRTFEDRMVALLGKRGVKGIPGYEVIQKRGRVVEAELRPAIAASGAEGVLITRVTHIDKTSGTVPGGIVAVGTGWGGFYSYWDMVQVPPQQVTGQTWTVSETRLFDARSGTLVWTGVMDTKENDDLTGVLTQYIDVVFDAMVHDRVL